MKRRSLAALCAIALMLTACTSHNAASESASAGSPDSITLGLTFIPNIQFAPVYVAEHEGYFEDAGLDVTIRHHGAQESLMGALVSGEEDVVFAGGDEMLQARSNGVDVVNWATMYQHYPVTLIVPEDSDIHTPADLRGKKVGLPGPYGENYFALLAMFRANGLSDTDVSVQYVGYTQAAALSAGEVDAIVGFANSDLVNIASTLSTEDISALDPSEWPVRSIDMVSGGLPLVGVGLGSPSASVKDDADAYSRLLSALDRAVQFSAEHPEETLDITAQYVPDLSEPDKRSVAAVTLRETLALYTGADTFGSQNAERWAAMADFMWSNNLLEEQVDPQTAFVDLTR